MSPEDFAHPLSTDLFSAAPEEAQNQLVSCVAPLTVRAEERVIRQGDAAHCPLPDSERFMRCAA